MCSQANEHQQSNLQIEFKDLEFLLPGNSENSPSNDISVAYQDGQAMNSMGPIVLSTPATYSRSKSPPVNPNATCWEVLTLRLGRFAREHMEKNGANSVTDDMLQNEARMILYGESDGWEQTVADHPEWLNLFKKAHGIDANAPVTGQFNICFLSHPRNAEADQSCRHQISS